MLRSPYAVLIALVLASNAGSAQAVPPVAPPPELLGDFVDDYGISFHISDTLFLQRPRARYRIIEWNVAGRFLIAQNAADNPSDAGLWTRIDWMPFTGMAPYAWGFCLTAYKAPSAAAARATPPADRSTPRTGCNGFPFSRMRRPE
jgi:hypothetical protein